MRLPVDLCCRVHSQLIGRRSGEVSFLQRATLLFYLVTAKWSLPKLAVKRIPGRNERPGEQFLGETSFRSPGCRSFGNLSQVLPLILERTPIWLLVLVVVVVILEAMVSGETFRCRTSRMPACLSVCPNDRPPARLKVGRWNRASGRRTHLSNCL